MRSLTRIVVALAIVCSLTTVSHAVPQLINFQGILTDAGGTPITTSTNVRFAIWDNPSTGSMLWFENQSVTPDADGRFNVLLGSSTPIPDAAFAGNNAYLGVKVSTNLEMTPRSRLVSVAYAYRPGTVDGATGGTISGDVSIQSNLSVDGNISATGKATFGPNNSNFSTTSLVVGEDHLMFNNYSTIAGGFDNRVDDLYSTISGGKAHLNLGPYNTIGGGSENHTDYSHSTIGGGFTNDAIADYATVGGGFNNSVFSRSGTVGGGESNRADSAGALVCGGQSNRADGLQTVVVGGVANQASGFQAFVGGGNSNDATAPRGTIVGGFNNEAGGDHSFIGGGLNNTTAEAYTTIGGGGAHYVDGFNATISGGVNDTAHGDVSVIAGGSANTTNGYLSAIGGGTNNLTNGRYSVVPGGAENETAGDYSFACGYMAQAVHNGAYAWADANGVPLVNSTLNSWQARATGGFYLYTNTAHTAGVSLASGASAWAVVSDSTLKRNIRPIDSEDILERVRELPISRWNYDAQSAEIEHIGPMAQDFYRLFGVGDNNTTITTIDPDGIALAAIQELDKRNKTLTEQNRKLEREMAELRAIVNQLVADK